MIDKNKKKSIDNLVSELKSKYDTKSLDGLKQLSKDMGISVIEDDKIILSFADEINEKKYIFLGKTLFKKRKLIDFTHEIGHHLLDHFYNPRPNQEEEADYFSEQLGCKRPSFLRVLAICQYSVLKSPFLAFNICFLPHLDKKHCLDIIKEYNSQKEKTI